MDSNHVWICGAGLVSSLGLDVETVGQRLEDGESGVRLQDQFDGEIFASPLCAPVQNFKANAYLKNRKNLKNVKKLQNFKNLKNLKNLKNCKNLPVEGWVLM